MTPTTIQPQVGFDELKQRVASYREQVSAQRARVEQAEVQVKDATERIKKDFGVDPAQLPGELEKTNKEIQQVGGEILNLLTEAGA